MENSCSTAKLHKHTGHTVCTIVIMIAHPRSALFERVRDSVIFVPFHSSAHKHFARKVLICSLLPDFVQFFSAFFSSSHININTHTHTHHVEVIFPCLPFEVCIGSCFLFNLLPKHLLTSCSCCSCSTRGRRARTHCTLFSSSQPRAHTPTKICQLLNGNKNGNEQQQQTMREAGLNFSSRCFFFDNKIYYSAIMMWQRMYTLVLGIRAGFISICILDFYFMHNLWWQSLNTVPLIGFHKNYL